MSDLTPESCNLVCFDSVKQRRFNLGYNRFLPRRPKKKNHTSYWPGTL